MSIRRNQITGLASNLGAEGILVNHGKNSTGVTYGLVVSGNTINDVVGGTSSRAIELSGPTPNAQVTQNDIDLATSTAAGAAGVYFDSNASANSAAGSVTVSGNRLTGAGYGVAVAGGATINASGNWWGSANESAVAARTSGSVDMSPFLTSGTDTDLATAGFQGDLSGLTVTALGAQTGSTGRIQEGINLVTTGGTVNVGAGTYSQASTLYVNKALTLSGSGEAATTIDARSVTSATGSYGMSVNANDVTLRDFTFYGPSAYYASAYGIKVSPGGSADARLRNFTIRNVTSRGAGKAELDLNGVDGALIDGVTLNGAPVGNDAGTTQGAGLQLTDSANVTVRNTTTLNNAWGGVALYQANRSYNQRVNNITLEGNNHFNEANPVYLQDESVQQDFGTLSIAGFDYAVRNASNADSNQYTWLQASKQKAYDYAVNLSGAGSSYIQGWDGSTTTQNFEVGVGNLIGGGTQAMSIATALSRSTAGAGISIGAGTYDEGVTLASRRDLHFAGATLQSLRLNAGADNSGLGGQVTVTGGAGITLNADVNLLADSVLTTTGGNISVNGQVQSAAPYDLTLYAGAGASRGNVSLSSGGGQDSSLGTLQVRADRFTLSDTLWVRRYQIDALGQVALSDHTLRATAAGVTSTLTAGGNVSGSTVSRGSVVVNSGGNVAANITAEDSASVVADNISGTLSGVNVTATAAGTVNVVAAAANVAALRGNTIKGNVHAVSAKLEADSRIDVGLDAAAADVRAGERADVSGAAGHMTITAPRGHLTGSFDQVDVIGNGIVEVNGKPQVKEEITKKLENIPVIPVIVLPVPVPMPVVVPPPVPAVVPAVAPAPAPVPAAVSAPSSPAPTPSGAPAGSNGAAAGSGTAASGGGGGGSNGTGGSSGGAASTSTSTSGTSTGSGEAGGAAGSGGGEGGASSGSGASSGGGGSSSGTSASGGSRSAGRPAGGVTVGSRLAPTSRSAPGKAGESLDKGQAVEIDLTPGR